MNELTSNNIDLQRTFDLQEYPNIKIFDYVKNNLVGFYNVPDDLDALNCSLNQF